MKIYAINASPRKNWNSAKLLEGFVKGVKEENPDAEVEVINIYDYDFKGCRSCFACKLKATPNQCMIKDSIQQFLIDIRKGDGLVFASPVYYFDQPGYFRAFMERLLYPGPVKGKAIPVTAIYYMNATSEAEYQEYMGDHFKFTHMMIQNCFHGPLKELKVFDSFQREDSDAYQASKSNHVAKKERYEREFPGHLENAFNAGREMVKEIRAIQAAEATK